MSAMVTIDIPAPFPPFPRPQGVPDGAESLAATLHRTAGRFEELAEEAGILSDASTFWVGDAADAYAASAGRLAQEYEPMAATLTRVSRGVDAFADTLRDLMNEYVDLDGTRGVFERDRFDLLQEVRGSGEVTDAEIAAFQTRAQTLHAMRATLQADIDDWQRRVTENEELLLSWFQAADTKAEAVSADGGIGALALGVIGSMPKATAGPAATKAWWDGLTSAEREAMIAAYPDRIGMADGLPAAVRNDANRLLLSGDLAELGQKEQDVGLSALERRMLENARAAESALAHADTYVMPGTDDRPGGTLWLYDPAAFDGDGRVAIAVGDLDTAEDVSIQIPGIRTEMNDAPTYAVDATSLYESARYAGAGSDGSSVATMFWLGYDTPNVTDDVVGTVTEGRARDAGERLAAAVEGLRASRPEDRAHMTAIGHSYGSTSTAYAATEFHLDVDDVVLVGNPGTGTAETAADFSVGKEHVFVGRNSYDFVAMLGDQGDLSLRGLNGLGLGVDASSEQFGARRFEAEAVDRGSSLDPFADHNKYFVRDSESLYNLGRIVDGQVDAINIAENSYDPWYFAPVDPEIHRPVNEAVEDGSYSFGDTPGGTSDVSGRSDTGYESRKPVEGRP